MQLKFEQIQRDIFDRLESPTLILKKPHGAVVGPLGDYHGLKLELKYNEISEGSFVYPKQTDHGLTPFYEQLVADKLIQIDPYGVFVVREAVEQLNENGVFKEISLYSLEYELAGKKVILGQGTYPLWNEADPENCLLNIVLENSKNWSVGRVDSDIALRYRTFSDTDSSILEFLQGEVQKSYGCVVVFNTRNRTVNIYNAVADAPNIPVYLSYDNLLKEGNIKELGENIITKLYVQGAEGIDIRNVNPTGENYIYNLDWYIENGDLDPGLVQKWRDWQQAIESKQGYYAGLVLMKASETSRLMIERAKLTDIENAIATQENIQSTWLQMKKTGTDPETAQNELDAVRGIIAQLKKDLVAQQILVKRSEEQIAQYNDNIASINQSLKFANYFHDIPDALVQLDCYFKEDTLQDDTFAVFDVDISSPGAMYKAENLHCKWSGVASDSVSVAAADTTYDNVFYSLKPLKDAVVTISGRPGWQCSANLVSGIVDRANAVVTLILGAGHIDIYDTESGAQRTLFAGGTTTLVGEALSMGSDYGAFLPENMSQASMYFTSNATGYQQCSVEQSLYDHAIEHLAEAAFPTYEFEISSGNILSQKDFAPFAAELALGRRCYLQIDEDRCLTPVLLEVHVDFESPDSFNLVFANTFRRPDNVNSLKDILRETTSASRTLKSKELTYGENNNTTTWVKELLDRGFDAAMTRINSGESSVSFGKSGIKVESNEGDIIYLGNGMIALHDSTSNEVRMAMGHFKDASGSDYVGVLADVIAGTLVAGQRLVIECPEIGSDGKETGVMQFKVDSSGVQLHNGSFYMARNGRAVCIDPIRGFMLGKEGMISWVDGVPSTTWGNDGAGTWQSFQDQSDVSLWLSKDGTAYFKGNVYATDGWFTGIVQAKDIKTASGVSMLDLATNKFKSEYLDLGNIQLDGETGSITMTGDINLSSVSSINWGSNSPIKSQFAPKSTGDWSDTMRTTDKYRRDWDYVQNNWGVAYQFVGIDGRNGSDASVPAYIGSTYIDLTQVRSPKIYANEFDVVARQDTGEGSFNLYSNFNNSVDPYHMLEIAYSGLESPFINFSSPAGAQANWLFKQTAFSGDIDFRGANVSGLYLTFS